MLKSIACIPAFADFRKGASKGLQGFQKMIGIPLLPTGCSDSTKGILGGPTNFRKGTSKAPQGLQKTIGIPILPIGCSDSKKWILGGPEGSLRKPPQGLQKRIGIPFPKRIQVSLLGLVMTKDPSVSAWIGDDAQLLPCLKCCNS